MMMIMMTTSFVTAHIYIIFAPQNSIDSWYGGMVRRYGTEAEIQLPLKRSSRFQCLFPNPSWLVWGRASRHQKLAPTFPGIDSCLTGTKRDFSKWKRHYESTTNTGGPKMLLKVDRLPNAVGKQPSMPLIYLGRKWTLNWWWWWWWWCALIKVKYLCETKKYYFSFSFSPLPIIAAE